MTSDKCVTLQTSDNASKRFLILTQYFPPEVGASQARLASLAIELTRLGHSVEIITAMPHHLKGQIYNDYIGKFHLHETWEGMRVRRTWVYPASSNTVSKRLANYGSFLATSSLELLKTKSPDFLFVESPPLFLSIPGITYGALRRVPVILNIADLWPDSVRMLGVMSDGLALRLAERLELLSYRRTTYINAVTEGIRDALIVDKKVNPTKILFLPNGVDTDVFRPRAPDQGLISKLDLVGKKVLLYAGTHGIAYRLELLARAAALLRNTDIVFLIIGDGFTKNALVQLVRELNLTNVILLDSQPYAEMPRYFSLAYASIVPLAKNQLFQATCPAKIAPSLASGVPIIYSGEGEGARLVARAEGGLVIPPESLPRLVDAVLQLTNDTQLHAAMASGGRRYAVEHCGWKNIVANWLTDLLQKDHSRITNSKRRRS